MPPTPTEVPVTPAPVASATVAAEAPVLGAVVGKLTKERGKIILRLDCTGLHNYLEAIGVRSSASDGRYQDAPADRYDAVNPGTHKLLPKALCFRTKLPSGVWSSVVDIDIMRQYSVPPTLDAIKLISESVGEARQAVIDHYQPVEISISITSKKPAPASAE